jgi:hypothetical protein
LGVFGGVFSGMVGVGGIVFVLQETGGRRRFTPDPSFSLSQGF